MLCESMPRLGDFSNMCTSTSMASRSLALLACKRCAATRPDKPLPTMATLTDRLGASYCGVAENVAPELVVGVVAEVDAVDDADAPMLARSSDSEMEGAMLFVQSQSGAAVTRTAI